MKTKLNLSGITILILLLSACGGDNMPKNFDYGTVENSVYSNTYFEFTMDVPDQWIVQSKEQNEQLMETGEKLIAGDDKSMKAALNASDVNVANLLTVFKYETGSPVDFNPSYMFIAENVMKAPGVKTGSDYFFNARKILEQSQTPYKHIDEEYSTKNLGGKDFYVMNTEIEYMGISIYQAYYCRVDNGFALNLIISYSTDDEKDELEKIVESISFQ